MEGAFAVDSLIRGGVLLPPLSGEFDYAGQELEAQAELSEGGRVVLAADARIPVNLALSGARELGLCDHVTFTGRVPDAEMLAMLNTADICVNPDVANPMNDISTMNKVMEYMALGKPIVQFDLAEGRFSAQDASLYARRNDPRDLAAKIVELLDDPEKRKAMGAFGRRR